MTDDLIEWTQPEPAMVVLSDPRPSGHLDSWDRLARVGDVVPAPCPDCDGTGWIPDDPTAGPDGSAHGCPTCTPPGGCGGAGTIPVELTDIDAITHPNAPTEYRYRGQPT